MRHPTSLGGVRGLCRSPGFFRAHEPRALSTDTELHLMSVAQAGITCPVTSPSFSGHLPDSGPDNMTRVSFSMCNKLSSLVKASQYHTFLSYLFLLSRMQELIFGLAPIFPYTFYHLTHYWFAASGIPVANDIPAHYADAIRYNARRPPQGSLPLLTHLVSA